MANGKHEARLDALEKRMGRIEVIAWYVAGLLSYSAIGGDLMKFIFAGAGA